MICSNLILGEEMFDENKFWELLNMWKYQTALLSSSTKILSHLHKLTSEWPVKEEYRGNGKKIIECWLSWGKKHGYQV